MDSPSPSNSHSSRWLTEIASFASVVFCLEIWENKSNFLPVSVQRCLLLFTMQCGNALYIFILYSCMNEIESHTLYSRGKVCN